MDKTILEEYFDSTTISLIQDIESLPNVEISVDPRKKEGFYGVDAEIIIISVILGGIFKEVVTGIIKGLLSSIGKDIWTKIKQLFASKKDKKSESREYKYSIKISVTIDSTPVFLICDLNAINVDENIKKLDLFKSALFNEEAKIEEQIISQIEKNPLKDRIEMVFTEDQEKRWKTV